jgi:putative endonuclease
MVTRMPVPSRDKILKGRRGEQEALNLLLGKGHRILERNFRASRGEIDLITLDGETLVFVEVKSGSAGVFGEPEDRVDGRKQKRIGSVAAAYLAGNPPGHQDCRFDVVSVVRERGSTVLRHIEDAFWLEP